METSTPTSFKCGYRDNDSDTSLSPISVMNEPGNVGSCLIDHNLGEEKTNLIDSGNGDGTLTQVIEEVVVIHLVLLAYPQM